MNAGGDDLAINQAWYSLDQDLFHSRPVGGDGCWLDAPLSVCMQTGTRCNLLCHFCLSDSGALGTSDGGWLTGAVSALTHSAGPTRLVWSGGEPTLIRDLDRILAISKSLGHINVVATNGTREFSSPYADWIDVSLYGADEAQYELRTGRRVCERVWANLGTMLAGPARISINVLLGMYPNEALVAIVSRALEAGVTRMKFHRALPIGRHRANGDGSTLAAQARIARDLLDGSPAFGSFPLSASAGEFIDSYMVVRTPGVLTTGRWSVSLDDGPAVRSALSGMLASNRALFIGPVPAWN